MTHKALKFSIAAIVLLGAITYLSFLGAQKGWVTTMGVDQYLADVAQQHSRVRLCGTVGEEGLDVNKGLLSARFTLKGEKGEMQVAYKGTIPDMFKSGADIVIEGKRNEQGIFVADQMMTKCASKYEERPKTHPNMNKEGSRAG